MELELGMTFKRYNFWTKEVEDYEIIALEGDEVITLALKDERFFDMDGNSRLEEDPDETDINMVCVMDDELEEQFGRTDKEAKAKAKKWLEGLKV